MEVLHEKVRHTVFGLGTVVAFDGKHVTIKFPEKICKFVYPDAFNSFLKMDDCVKQDMVLSVLRKEQEEKQKIVQMTVCENKSAQQVHVSKKKEKDIAKGFGLDYHVDHLAREPILTYKQVEEQFGIKIAGFGRGINRTDSSVILISSVVKKKDGFVYHDHWTKDGDYIYSGEGKAGNQAMTAGNKAIIEAETEGKKIYLFVKFSPQEYYYQGEFKLVGYTSEEECDVNGCPRKEYKFQLRKVDPIQ